jgi:hypothetical protein
MRLKKIKGKKRGMCESIMPINELLRACLAVRFNLRFAKFKNFFFAKIECGLYFLDRFDVLMLKMIFKK